MEGKAMRVITTITLRIGAGENAKYVQPGTKVDLDEKEAEALLQLGHVQPVPGKEPPKEDKPSIPTTDKKPANPS
jgi:hypothetical protein